MDYGLFMVCMMILRVFFLVLGLLQSGSSKTKKNTDFLPRECRSQNLVKESVNIWYDTDHHDDHFFYFFKGPGAKLVSTDQ